MPTPHRRIVALVMALLLCVAGSVALADTEETPFRVTLLGTGMPVPQPERMGPATLVEAGGQKLLFDAGRGATIRLYQLGVPLREVGPLFLTHFHSDHTSGIPDLWLSGWLGGPWARRTTPFRVIGPAGTRELMTNLERAYGADIRTRMADEHYPAEGIRVIAEEFTASGIVYERNGVRVTAIEVDHGDLIKPAYGYRVDFDGRSLVMSGDTRFSERLARQAAGADVVVHEVAAVRPELLKDPQVRRVMAHHTSPQEAGRLFGLVRPRLAVYTHLVLLSRPQAPPLTIDGLVAQTRETYDGPLVVGEDLMTLKIGTTGVDVERRARD